MRIRFGILAFNLALAVSVAALYAWALSGDPFGREALVRALKHSWWAGFVVGLTVGLGAGIGSRPALPLFKCAIAQAMVVASSLLGAWIGSLFPVEIAEAEQAVRGYLADRGIVIGSWIGATVGTAVSILDVYRQRRKAARKQEREGR